MNSHAAAAGIYAAITRGAGAIIRGSGVPVMAMFMGIVLAGCVPAGGDVRRDINDLKQSSYQSRKDTADNSKSIESLKATVADLKRAQADIPKERSLSAIRNSQTTLLGRVNDLHEEVQSLMSTVERELNETKKLSRQTAADLDVVKATSGGGAQGGDVSARLSTIEAELALIKKKLSIRQEASGATATAADDSDGITAEDGSPEGQYKAAYDLFKKKKYSDARKAFETFMAKNRNHKWAGNALFWIGETYYAEKTYDSAILAYYDVKRKYPKSNKVPDAMLKQGYAFMKLGDPLAAKGALQELVQLFPDSQAAKHAREKLKTLD